MDIDSHHNQKFNLSESLAQVDRILATWWRTTSQSGLSISRDDIREIVLARESIKNHINTMFDQIIESSDIRRHNLNEFRDWKFISLGEDCFSRTVLTRWGVKPSASFGERSTPFDLSVHPVSSLIALLDSDFQGYLDEKYLEFSENLNFCKNNKYRVGFNHEVGSHYADNNFQLLKDAYNPRVERFRQHMSEVDKICFALHIRNPASARWSDVKKLWDILCDKCSAKEKILICISTWKFGEKINREYHGTVASDNVHLVDANYPQENYVWHRHAHFPNGHEFEKNVVNKFCEVLRIHSLRTTIKAEN